jgi:hypothetical protein
MSSESPAAHLARLKVEFQSWRFWRGEHTHEFWAQPPPDSPHRELVSAPSVPELEAKVREFESWRQG